MYWVPYTTRSSRQEVFCKKGVPRNLAKFKGKHFCQSLFFNKVADLRPATLLKRRLWHMCFPLYFTKFLRTTFLQNTSGGCFCTTIHCNALTVSYNTNCRPDLQKYHGLHYISGAYRTKSKHCYSGKPSAYFYAKTKISWYFHISISVPLNTFERLKYLKTFDFWGKFQCKLSHYKLPKIVCLLFDSLSALKTAKYKT